MADSTSKTTDTNKNKAAEKGSFLEKLKFLFSPAAIGIYLTLGLTYATKIYFDQREQITSEDKGFVRLMYDLDSKSVDYRLLLRGPQAPHPDVAVLAVDNRSIDQIGRWPWPREVLAKALDAAYDNGAKAIAADVVWSEPTYRPEVQLLTKLSEQGAIPASSNTKVNALLTELDSDRLFSQFIEKRREQFVLGNFFESPKDWYQRKNIPGYTKFCIDAAFENKDFKQVFDKLERQPIVIDDRVATFPEMLSGAYKGYFAEYEEDLRSKLPPADSNKQREENDALIKKQEMEFCEHAFLRKTDKDNDIIAMNVKAQWAEFAPQIITNTAPPKSFEEWVRQLDELTPRSAIPETLDWTLNIPEVFKNGVYHGYFNAVIDPDGVLRKSLLAAETGTRMMSSIGLWGYLLGTDSSLQLKMGPHATQPNIKGIHEMTILDSEGEPKFTVPADLQGYLWINYRGPAHTIPHASIADLLNEKKTTVTVDTYSAEDGKWFDHSIEIDKKQFFKNKILVLGATAIGVYDLRNTAFDPIFPGVETHANVIDNLLRKDFLHIDPREEKYMPIVMLSLGVLLSLVLSHSGALAGLLLTAAIATGLTLADKYFFFGKGSIVSVAFPLLQTIITYMGLTFYKYFTEERSKKELRQTFSKYVSPSIVEEILKDPKNLELGGRKERVTVFFSDVRGFTTISEKLDPRALSDLLNSYLTPMTDLVFENKGTLDKYMGDAVMAFFGAPLPMKDHAKWACRCALKSLVKLEELRANYRKQGLPDIDIGIGLNTGEVSVGNMGSQSVRSYTVMGDSVNLASRLEGINKEYGTRTIISEFTYADVKDSFTCREVDWVKVKGKKQPVKIFELIAEGNLNGDPLKAVEAFNRGYACYHEKKFSEAVTAFNLALSLNPNDNTSKIYVERCQEYITEPPPNDWDGVYVMKTK